MCFPQCRVLLFKQKLGVRTMTVLTEIPERKENSYKIPDDASSLPDIDILQRPQSRRRTDTVFLYVFVACVILLIPFLIYTLCYSDINRLKGTDDCGNICGQKNIKYDQWNCSGRDLTLKPVPGYKSCMDSESWPYTLSGKSIFTFMRRLMWKVLLVSFVPLALCLILVVLFPYHPAVTVWSVLVISWLIFTGVGLSYLLNSYYYSHIVLVTIFCIISILVLSWIIFHLNDIPLATGLLREATRPLFEVKKMYYVSLGALATSTVIILTFATIYFHILTAGKLGYYRDYVAYLPDWGMITARILIIVLVVWGILIVLGVQDMTISGVVAQWCTTKNQDNLDGAVPSSLRFTVINHLGTIVLGSILMVVMSIPRAVLQFLAVFSSLKEKADAGLGWLDGFFTNFSYIVTATYGTTYVESGRQASKLLKLSIGKTRDLNNFVNSVIMIAQGLIVFVSTTGASNVLHYRLESHRLYSDDMTYVVCGIAGLCSFAFLGTLKVTFNTLFFCTIEELLRNKEDDQPFTMTVEEFIDGSNKLVLQKDQSSPALNIPEKSFYKKVFVFIFVGVTSVLFFVAYYI